MDMITQGMIAAATVIWILSYFGLRKVFNFAPIVDIACTGLLVFMFSGSYAGMMTGVIGGMAISFFLRGGRAVAGTSKPKMIRRRGHILPSVVWVRSK
jgi:hypothetical protein